MIRWVAVTKAVGRGWAVVRLLRLLTLGALVAACTPAPEAPGPGQGAGPAGLPRGYVRTDGHGDVVIEAPGRAACAPLSPAEKAQALASANAARAGRGQPPLALHPVLQAAADRQACEMAQRGTMTHDSRQGGRPGPRLRALGYSYAVTTENIAAGRLDLARVQAEWGGSPAHLANVVRPGLRHMGIGRALGPDGRTSYWAAIYAQPR